MLNHPKPLTVRVWRCSIAIAILFAAGCEIGFGPGVLDWSYDLPGGCYIWRASSHTIEIHGRIEIPAKVVELDFDNRFLIAKQQHLTERSPGDSYMIPDDGNFSWWIGDFKTGTTIGPLDESEFAEQRNALGVSADLVLHDVYDYKPDND